MNVSANGHRFSCRDKYILSVTTPDPGRTDQVEGKSNEFPSSSATWVLSSSVRAAKYALAVSMRLSVGGAVVAVSSIGNLSGTGTCSVHSVTRLWVWGRRWGQSRVKCPICPHWKHTVLLEAVLGGPWASRLWVALPLIGHPPLGGARERSRSMGTGTFV